MKPQGRFFQSMRFISSHSLIQEELRAAIEAEILDAAGEVHIAGEDAEALHGADVSKVDDYLVRQWLHDDVLVLRQMVHLVFVYLLVLVFAQYETDALVRLEEGSENLLSLVLVFCGEYVLQIVFQVVLCELCHNAFFRVKDGEDNSLGNVCQEWRGDFFLMRMEIYSIAFIYFAKVTF